MAALQTTASSTVVKGAPGMDYSVGLICGGSRAAMVQLGGGGE
jgi:hypothetical protein